MIIPVEIYEDGSTNFDPEFVVTMMHWDLASWPMKIRAIKTLFKIRKEKYPDENWFDRMWVFVGVIPDLFSKE